MSDRKGKIAVLELPLFKKQFKKLSDTAQQNVADQIDLIVDDPLIGEQKKGDLSHIRVHRFILNDAQVLLDYSWQARKVTIFLLSIGPHENFYKDLSLRRKADIKQIK